MWCTATKTQHSQINKYLKWRHIPNIHWQKYKKILNFVISNTGNDPKSSGENLSGKIVDIKHEY